MKEIYYLGQGRVGSRVKGSASNALQWWGDVSGLSITASEESIGHRESYSGFRREVRNIVFNSDMTVNMTVHSIDTRILAMSLRGTVSTIPAGAVTGESLGTVVVGDIFKLDNGINVDNVVITDSAATPVTIAAQHYDVNAASGLIEFLSLPAALPAMPLLASYEHDEGYQVVFQNRQVEDIELFYDGVNLAEGGKPISLQLYKVTPGVLQDWALINDATALAGLSWTGRILADTSKPANGPLGQVGRVVQSFNNM